MSHPRFRNVLLRVGLVCGVLGALAAPATAAVTTYTYTAYTVYNAKWSSWMDNSGLGRALYAGLDSSGIKFSFTVTAPLSSVGCGTNPYSIYCQSDVTSQLQSWHYNGGSPFLNVGSDVAGSTMSGLLLSTDANGVIQNDRFYLNGPVVIPGLSQFQSSLYEAHDGYDQQNLFSTFTRPYQGSAISLSEGMSNFGGSWTMVTSTDPVTSAAPEPSSWALMVVGVGGLGAALRMRRRRVAA
jgi:hypothetical protein